MTATPAAATPSGARSGANDPRTDGQPDCRFQRPDVWASGKVAWLGACQKGFAEGSGVLVNVVEGVEPERFYGQLDGGAPSLGVLQTDNGFVAGHWNHGAAAKPLPDDVAQRNATLEAFRAAADAAGAVSKSFAQKSDTQASSFYAAQARVLREQLD